MFWNEYLWLLVDAFREFASVVYELVDFSSHVVSMGMEGFQFKYEQEMFDCYFRMTVFGRFDCSICIRVTNGRCLVVD